MAVKSSKPDFDRVILHNLALSAAIGPEAWHRLDRPQPVVLDLSMQTNIELAGDTDDVLHTIHYGYLCKAVTKVVERQKPFLSIKEFADEVSKAALGPGGGKHLAELTVTLPKAVLLAAGLGLSTVRVVEKKGTDAEEMMVVSENVFVRDMKLACIIGVNPHERLEKQNVVLNLTFFDVQENVFTGYHVLLKKITDVGHLLLLTLAGVLTPLLKRSSSNNHHTKL